MHLHIDIILLFIIIQIQKYLSSQIFSEIMKAAVRSLTGSIAMKENYSRPDSCGSKEVLVDVKAAGINPVDYKVSINVKTFDNSLFILHFTFGCSYPGPWVAALLVSTSQE